MESRSHRRYLSSCTLNKSLLTNLERRLLHGVPKQLDQALRKILSGLGLDSYKKLERYQIIVEKGKKSQVLSGVGDLPKADLEPGTHRVRLIYRLGAPKIITVDILFAQNEQPWIELTTQSPHVEKILPYIAEGVVELVASHGTRHRIAQSRAIQAVMLFSVPGAVMAYGLWRGVDMFLLYSSMGWLCLLLLGVSLSLPRVFPWVTFQTQRRFPWKRLPPVASIVVLTLAIVCYIGLVLLHVPPAEESPVVMLASLMG
ncbi:MAG: hypothetical protein JRE16_05965 [Deltaproteobacteria bacterium]|jgi:hypothetical protein|nr:hypothetical protein [Deltaproteobacteria bacterium]